VRENHGAGAERGVEGHGAGPERTELTAQISLKGDASLPVLCCAVTNYTGFLEPIQDKSYLQQSTINDGAC